MTATDDLLDPPSERGIDDDTVRLRARHLLFDYLAVARRGASSPPGATIGRVLGAEGRSILEGTGGRRASALSASLINAVAAHAIELDDTHESSSLHPGVVVWPAVLALADQLEATIGDVLAAGIAGYEAVCALGGRLDPRTTYARGFHPTGVCGPIGAAAAASRLLGLDATREQNAIAIATSTSSGLMEFLSDGAWTKPLHAGHAASSGIVAAQLSAAGYAGPLQAVEGPHGFLHAFGRRQGEPGHARQHPGAGILETAFKLYPCCRYIHPNLDLILELVHDEGLEVDDVSAISCGILSAGRSLVAEPADEKRCISTVVDAQFSMPFAAAIALAEGDVSLEHFAGAAERAQQLEPLMARIECHRSDRLDAGYPGRWGGEIVVRTKGGQTIVRESADADGSPRRPLSRARLLAKAGGLVGDDVAADLLTACEHADDMAPVTALLR